MSLLDANIADHPSVIIDADSMYEDMFGYPTVRSRMGMSRSRGGNLGKGFYCPKLGHVWACLKAEWGGGN